MKHVLVTGGTGQVGIELARAGWPQGTQLHLPTRAELDLASESAIAAFLATHPFDAVINSAAYTAVDRAEDDVAAAFATNAVAPALLADATRRAGIPIVQLSTDYVFDGSKGAAYVEDDAVAPLGVYGASKLAGEFAVRSANPRSIVLRTAWVISAHRTNFVKTMRRIGSTRPEIGVVADQIGCPTAAADIADAVVRIVTRLCAPDGGPTGVYHFVNAGQASWHDLARTVFALGTAPAPILHPLRTEEYPTPARRPANSRMSTAKLTRDFGIVPRPWQESVAEIVAELERDIIKNGVDA